MTATATTAAKTPHAATISRLIAAKANGYKVSGERGQRIDFNLNQSVGARFPVVLVSTSGTDVDAVAEKINAAGYAAEIRSRRDDTTTDPGYGIIIVVSQEELDDRAARAERAANADALAEEMVPPTTRVTVRLTTYPDHARRTHTTDRTTAVTMTAAALALASTDVMDADSLAREIAADWDLNPYRGRLVGLSVITGGKRATMLLMPVDEPEATPYAGPYDVRVFSSAQEHKPRGGVVCIIVAQDAEQARATIARESSRDGRTAAAYMPDTAQRVTLPTA